MKAAIIIVATALPASVYGQDAAAVLQSAEQRYASIRTLQADFRQIIENDMLGGPEETNGVLYLAPPDQFAMRFIDPAGDRIVADGQWLWLFNPSSIDDQVIRTSIPESGPATPNLFAQFVERPESRYHVTYVKRDETLGRPVHVIGLVPRSEDMPFREATVHVDVANGILRAIGIVEHSGQRRYLEFSNLVQNRPISDSEFTFTVPSGVRVVTPPGSSP